MQIKTAVVGAIKKRGVRGAALGIAILGAVGLFVACSAESGGSDEVMLATTAEPVQLAWVGSSEATTTTGVNLLKANSRSVKGKATGAMRYGLANGVKFNCGVTFISHQYALTAAHCVPSTDLNPNTQTVNVEQYDTTNLDLNSAYGLQAQVTGTWPDFQRARKLSSADGYIVKPYPGCQIISRCSDLYGRFNCPLPAANSVDLALLRCPTRETNAVNYIKVASDQHANEVKNRTRNLEVWWFHEVLNLATSANMPYEPYMPNFNWEHYGKFQNDHTQNYHYWHSAVDTDRQLLPLVSKHTATNAPYQALAVENQYIVDTNVPVCHGTSGSGVLTAGADEFLGIVAEFGNTFDGIPLCVPITDSSAGNGMGYTQHNWARTLESLPQVLADR